jgi:hypothetical protein
MSQQHTPTASLAVFTADLDRMNTTLRGLGAVVTRTDTTTGESFQAVDPDKVPAQVLASYRRLLQYGAANGYL